MTIEKKYNPRCFFDVEVGEKPVGRIVFELFADVCPVTCENFRAICTGECGVGKTTGKPLHYKGVKFHRVIKNFMIQGGDFSVGNGSGGESIYGGTFKDESFDIRHDQPFLLSMANRGKDTNGSQFFITTQRTPHLDGVHVVFGRVIKGEDIVQCIENQPTDANSCPLQPVIISNCGELVLKKKQKEKKRRRTSASPSKSEAESGGEGSEKGEKKKHKKHHKHRSKKSKKEKNKDDESHNKENPDNDADEFTINPKEIPEVPANNFLMRRVDPIDDNYRGPPNRGGFNRRPMMSRSGRKIKGRGFMRYRTPSPEGGRSGSETPPHWKQAQSRIRPFREFEDAAKETENLDANDDDVAPENTEAIATAGKTRSHEPTEGKRDRSNRDRNRGKEKNGNRDRGQEHSRDGDLGTASRRERNRDQPQVPDRSEQKPRSREQNRSRDVQHEDEMKKEGRSRSDNGLSSEKRDRRERNDELPRSRSRHDHRDRRRSHSRDASSRHESRRKPDEPSSKRTSERDRHRAHHDSRRTFHGTQEEKQNSLTGGALHMGKELEALGADARGNESINNKQGDGRLGVISSMGKGQNVGQSERGGLIGGTVPSGARQLSSLAVMVDPTEPPPPGVEPDEFSLNVVESLPPSQSKWDRPPSGSSHKEPAPRTSEANKAPSPAPPRRNRWSSGPPSSNLAPDEEPKKRANELEKPTEAATISTARQATKPQIERRSGNASSSTRKQTPERQQKKSDQPPEQKQKESTRRGRSSSSASPHRRPSRSRSRGRRGRTRSSSEGRRRRQRNRSRSRSRKKSHRSASSSSRSDHRSRTRNRRRNRDSSDDGSRRRSRRARRRPSSSSSDSSSSTSSGDSGSSGRRRRRKRGRQSRRRRHSSTSSTGSSSS